MDSRPVGRDAEIADIRAFLSATSQAPAALAITGDAGIGKTMVWKQVVQASGSSAEVLSCQPTRAERPLAFSALSDLFGDVAEQVLPALPDPRRRAVQDAFQRGTSPGPWPAGLSEVRRASPERQVLARGVLDALRALSADASLVIAVDDVQRLDRPSASVLEFCLRLGRKTRRPAAPSA